MSGAKPTAPDSPKVMVAMPTRGWPWVHSILYAQRLATELGTGLAIGMGQPVTLMRNKLVRQFLKSDCTHLFFIDDDVVPPSGAIARLMAVNRPVATGLYPMSLHGRFVASIRGLHDPDWAETWPRDVFPVAHCGLGCALIQREVFERIGFPWFAWPEDEAGTNVGEDVWFCRRVRKCGLQIFCEGSVICGHIKGSFDLASVWQAREAAGSGGQ
jgi:hypothetical protein